MTDHDRHLLELIEILVRLIDATRDREAFTQLDRLVGELRPILERSTLHPALGEELWLYVGLRRDADRQMADNYRESLLLLLKPKS